MHLLLKDWPTFAWTIQGRFQKLRKLVAAGCTNISAKGHDLALQSGEGRCEGCLHLPLSLQLSRAASRIYNWQCQSQAASADTAQVPSTGGTLPIHHHSFIQHSLQVLTVLRSSLFWLLFNLPSHREGTLSGSLAACTAEHAYILS